MQETFMRLLRSGAFDRIEHPTAYLMRSARNLLIERARRKAREQCIALPYDEERDVPMQPEQTWRIEEADVRRIYRRTLRAMPRRTRRILLMHPLQCMSSRDIPAPTGHGQHT